MHRRKWSAKPSLMILLFAALLAGCTPLAKNTDDSQGNKPVSESEFLMGTIVKLTIFDEVEDSEAIFGKVFERIAEIEDKMTINDDSADSEIARLNHEAGKRYVKLSPDTFYVLEKGKYYSEISNGKYDITVGALVKLWNIGTDEARVPGEAEIENTISLVNYENLLLDKENLSAHLTVPGMIVDLGSIAKGYAADETAEILKESGIKHAIVNLGGNILVLNTRPDGTPWRIGLQDPFTPRGDYMGIVMLEDESLVTSGTYERYFEQDGKRYHHILNPETGYPEENSLLSVSIITKNSIDADGLSTATFLLGLEKGMQFIEGLPDTEAIFITSDKKVYVTSGISEEKFKITKEEYELVRSGVVP